MSSTFSSLTPAAQKVFSQFPVRKSKKQKQAFQKEVTALLSEKGWQVESQQTGRFVKSTNIVVGNPSSAKILYTAHYDTPARLPLPNFIAPNNLLATLLFQGVLALLVLIPPIIAMLIVSALTSNFLLSELALLLGLGTLFYLLMNGPANPANANDNTSGVLVLLEAALHLPLQLQNKVAFVFFDNEEKGLLGSAGFVRQNKSFANTPVVNFDCVGEGDTIAFCFNKGSRKDAALITAIQAAFTPTEEKEVRLFTSPFTFYPSDQMVFPKGVGVTALKKRFLLGLSIDKIHTKKDTVLQPENIILLQQGCCCLAAHLSQEASAKTL